MKDFECHITIKGERDTVSPIVNDLGEGWSFSCIDGDPELGLQEFCYATNHFEDETTSYRNMAITARYLYKQGLDVVRVKVERVIFDTRIASEWFTFMKS